MMNLGTDGITVRHQLIIDAIRSICSGPLGLQFSQAPDQLGAFAAAIADGVEKTQFEAALLSRVGTKT